MIAVAFRFEDSNLMGLAFAQNKEDLFWNIDQYGDPYSAELMSLKSCSVCIAQNLNRTEDEDEDDDEGFTPDPPESVEWDEVIHFGVWKKPHWNTDKIFSQLRLAVPASEKDMETF